MSLQDSVKNFANRRKSAKRNKRPDDPSNVERTKYMNKLLIYYVSEACSIKYWTRYEIKILKQLRLKLESFYNIPPGLFRAYCYFAIYRYKKSKIDPTNTAIFGFIKSEKIIMGFLNFLNGKDKTWFKRNVHYPDDYPLERKKLTKRDVGLTKEQIEELMEDV